MERIKNVKFFPCTLEQPSLELKILGDNLIETLWNKLHQRFLQLLTIHVNLRNWGRIHNISFLHKLQMSQ